MDSDTLFSIAFAVIWVAIVGGVVGVIVLSKLKPGIFKSVTGTIRSTMYGAEVMGPPAGEVQCTPKGSYKSKITIHQLGGDSPEKRVGLEIATSSFASRSHQYFTLSGAATEDLIQVLQKVKLA